MNVFWKTAAGVLTALILWISVSKHNKDISVLMTMAVCAMSVIAAVTFLQPIVAFVKKMQAVGNLDEELFSVILKVVGIGIVAEISTLICKDAGNESMGKTLQFVSAAAVLWMSIPVFEKLLTLLEKILGSL